MRSNKTLFAQPHPLFRVLSKCLMCLHERLVQLLALEVQVTDRSYHAQDHEGVPHESIRRASIEEVRELDEAQEVEDLVVGSIFQGTVELPDVPGLVRRGEHTLDQESHQDVGLLEVPVLVRGLA